MLRIMVRCKGCQDVIEFRSQFNALHDTLILEVNEVRCACGQDAYDEGYEKGLEDEKAKQG